MAANQFRCRDLNNSTIYLFAESDPVIESSENLVFAPYNLRYPRLDEQVGASELNFEENKWDLIFDFTDMDESGQKLIHFKQMDPSEFSMIDQKIEGIEEDPVQGFPVPSRYGGYAQDNDPSQRESDGTFDIRTTSAAEAQKIYEDSQKSHEVPPPQGRFSFASPS